MEETADAEGASTGGDLWRTLTELETSSKFITRLTRAIPDLLYIYDLIEDRGTVINRGAYLTLGYALSHFSTMDGDSLKDLIHPEDFPRVLAHIARIRSGMGDDTVAQNEYRMRHADGSWRWMFFRDVVFDRDQDGFPTQILGVAKDITERKKTEHERQAALDRFELAMYGFTAGIWEYDADTGRRFRSPHIAAILGYEGKEAEEWLASEAPTLSSHPDEIPAMREAFGAFLRGDIKEYEYEWRMRHRDGSWRWLLSRARAERYPDGTAYRVTGLYADITERKRQEDERQAALRAVAAFEVEQAAARAAAIEREAELLRAHREELEAKNAALEAALAKNEQLMAQLRLYARDVENMAIRDALTGLYNRRYLEPFLGQLFADACASQGTFALAILDLDNFKQINDRFSHLVGDMVLRTIANLLCEVWPSTATIARFGGEEFVAILPDASLEDVRAASERVRQAIEVFDWERECPGLSVTVSIGIADNTYAEDVDALLSLADQFLYEAKAHGKNRVRG